MIIRQSDLASYSYCAARFAQDKAAASAGYQPRRLSATILGTIAHYALQVWQKLYHEGRQDADEVALLTFEKYWSPEHAHEISEGFPNDWVPGHTWASDTADMKMSLQAAFDWMRKQSSTWLLGIEVSFNLDIEVEGESHILHGTMDRLVLRKSAGEIFLEVTDWKSGVVPKYLQFATQWTVYCYATTRPEFWEQYQNLPNFQEIRARLAAQGLALYEDGSGLPVIRRRGRYLEIRNGEFHARDCGWRDEVHYERLFYHLRHFVRSTKYSVYPPTTDNERCRFCAWREVCGNIGFPEYQAGIEDPAWLDDSWQNDAVRPNLPFTVN